MAGLMACTSPSVFSALPLTTFGSDTAQRCGVNVQWIGRILRLASWRRTAGLGRADRTGGTAPSGEPVEGIASVVMPKLNGLANAGHAVSGRQRG